MGQCLSRLVRPQVRRLAFVFLADLGNHDAGVHRPGIRLEAQIDIFPIGGVCDPTLPGRQPGEIFGGDAPHRVFLPPGLFGIRLGSVECSLFYLAEVNLAV